MGRPREWRHSPFPSACMFDYVVSLAPKPEKLPMFQWVFLFLFVNYIIWSTVLTIENEVFPLRKNSQPQMGWLAGERKELKWDGRNGLLPSGGKITGRGFHPVGLFQVRPIDG